MGRANPSYLLKATAAAIITLFVIGKPSLAESTSWSSNISGKWALVIGVSKFKEPAISDPSASSNAAAFAAYLTNEANFPKDHVKTLLNSDATRESILLAIGEWLASAKKNDLAIVYFATRGTPASMDSRGERYLMATDSNQKQLFSTGIASGDLPRLIRDRIPANRVLLIVDSDYSGAISERTRAGLRRSSNPEQPPDGMPVVITSCTKDQTKQAGFTTWLIKGLQQSGESTKLIDAFRFAQSNVTKEAQAKGKQQSPQMNPSGSPAVDSFMIAAKETNE